MDISSLSTKSYTLAVCLIVKNEAHNLAACLEPLQDFADSLWVTDTGSTDTTQAIAKQYTANLIDYPWHDDFAAARNQIYTQVKADWIMHVDADERWSEASLKALSQVLEKLDPTQAPYVVNVCFENGSQKLISLCLHSGHFAFHFSGRVHEKIELRVPEQEPIRLDYPLIRVPHLSTRTPEKAAYYERLLKQELANPLPHRRQAELYWHLADAQQQQKQDPYEAYQLSLKALTQAGWRHEWYDYLLVMTACTLQLQRTQTKVALRASFKQICELFPAHPAPWYYAS